MNIRKHVCVAILVGMCAFVRVCVCLYLCALVYACMYASMCAESGAYISVQVLCQVQVFPRLNQVTAKCSSKFTYG